MNERERSSFASGLRTSSALHGLLAGLGSVVILAGGFGVIYAVAVVWSSALALTLVVALLFALRGEPALARGLAVGVVLLFVAEVLLCGSATAIWMSLHPGAELS
jgi:hypothetical protein